MMYYRVDPAKSVGSWYWVLDSDPSQTSLESRSTDCTLGAHVTLKNAKLIKNQNVTCTNVGGGNLFTMIIYA